MDLGIKGRVAFIGASSKGLGYAVAAELANEGAQVIINGRNEDALSKAKSALEKISAFEVLTLKGDLSIAKERQKVCDAIFKRFNAVDILVTNTGGPPSGTFEDFDKEDWDRAYELLLGSAVEMIKAVLPGMKDQSWGRIITISSIATKQPVQNLILSNTVRTAILGLVKSLSNDLGKHKITVNNVMPGYTRTERLEKLMTANPSFNKISSAIPLQRIGEPEEFAAAVCFLASSRASYISGVSLAVDGGVLKSS